MKKKGILCVAAGCVLLQLMCLSACRQEVPDSEVQVDSTTAAQEMAFSSQKKLLSPSHSLSFGRESAMYRHLSRQWRMSRLNHSGVRDGIVLDLREIEAEVATLILDVRCKPIVIEFDMREAVSGRMVIKEIHRELTHCSDEFEDQMMSVLADVMYIEYGISDWGKDTLALISYQDKIVFEAAE